MLNNELITRLLHEIINSETLSKSQHSKQLLEYLVKATLEKKDIKEYTIAKEVFNKEGDTGVRAYIHNLRKKLDEYYKTEGSVSDFILSIPKGQYYVQVLEREKEFVASSANNSISFRKRNLLFAGSALVIVFILCFYFWTSRYKGPQDTLVWKDIMNSETPLLIVVGDHYFFHSRIVTGNTGITRDFYINSEAELEEWMIRNGKTFRDSIEKINYSYTTKQGPMSVFQIGSYFKRSPKVQLVFSSELTYEQLKNNNILFLGKYVTLGILRSLVDNKYLHEDRKEGSLSYILKDTIIKPVLKLSPSYKEDYPIVLKFRTPNQKTILMFISGDDPGNAAVLDYFLDLKNLSQIEKDLHLSEKENSFSALFKTVGLERTDYSIKYVTGEKINNDQ